MKFYPIVAFLLLPACGREKETTIPYRPAIAERRALAQTACPPPSGASAAVDETKSAEIAGWIESALTSNPRVSRHAKAELAAAGAAAAPFILSHSKNESLEDAERLRTISLLGEIRAPESARALLEIVEADPNPSRRLFAAEALGRTGETWTILRLSLRLKYEKDPHALAWIVAALAELGSFGGMPELFLANEFRSVPMEHLDPAVREELRVVLRRILAIAGIELPEDVPEDEIASKAIELSNDWKEGRREIRVDPAGVPCLDAEILRAVADLAGTQLRGVDDARFRLQRLGSLAVPALALGLEDENFYIRSHCIEVLGSLGTRGQAGAAGLLRLAKDPTHRADALAALGKVGAQEAAGEIEKGLREKAGEIRVAAAQALGNLKNQAALPALHRAMREWKSDSDFQVAAGGALLDLGDRAGIQALANAIDHPAVDQQALWKRLDAAFRAMKEQGLDDRGYSSAKGKAEKKKIASNYRP